MACGLAPFGCFEQSGRVLMGSAPSIVLGKKSAIPRASSSPGLAAPFSCRGCPEPNALWLWLSLAPLAAFRLSAQSAQFGQMLLGPTARCRVLKFRISKVVRQAAAGCTDASTRRNPNPIPNRCLNTCRQTCVQTFARHGGAHRSEIFRRDVMSYRHAHTHRDMAARWYPM